MGGVDQFAQILTRGGTAHRSRTDLQSFDRLEAALRLLPGLLSHAARIGILWRCRPGRRRLRQGRGLIREIAQAGQNHLLAQIGQHRTAGVIGQQRLSRTAASTG